MIRIAILFAFFFAFVFFVPASLLALEIRSAKSGLLQAYSDSQTVPIDTDPAWQPYSDNLASDGASFWVQQQVILSHESQETVSNPLALTVRVNGLYDFYWDGQLIGSNRHQGTAAPQYSRVIIPVSALAEGRHIFSVRITATGLRTGEQMELMIIPAAVSSSYFGVHKTVVSTFFVATAAFLVSVYLLVIWRTGSAQAGIGAALSTSLLVAVLILLQKGRHLFSYPYGWQPFLDILLPPVALLLSVALAWFVLTRLQIKMRILWLGIVPLSLLLSIPEIFGLQQDVRALFLLGTGLLAASFTAWKAGHIHARTFIAATLLSLVALLIDTDEKHLFLVFVTIAVAADLAYDIRRRTKEAAEHALTSERLRADLIKRNIQPHFLMNSLTALMEWVETAPDVAVEFIDGLAAEFRILSDFSERSSVSLDEEIALCKAHTRLMAMRLDADLHFEFRGNSSRLQVPPALFHTLLENAFSHNAFAGKKGLFRLTAESTETGQLYCFSHPVFASGQNPEKGLGTDPGTDPGTGPGTGIGSRYVTARLREFCGNAFSFASEQVGSNWVTTIQIPGER